MLLEVGKKPSSILEGLQGNGAGVEFSDAVRPAVIKSAASAASPEGFSSRDQVGR